MKKHVLALMAVLAIYAHIAKMTPAFATDDACSSIRAMVDKFNATPRIRVVGTDYLGTTHFTTLYVDTKQWWHNDSGPWHIKPRQYSKPSNIESCEHLGSETIDGVQTEIWSYHHLSYQQVDNFKSWISVDTGLPIKSHFKWVRPKDFVEGDVTYTYGPDIKDPV